MNGLKKSAYLVMVFSCVLLALFVSDAWEGEEEEVNEDGGVLGQHQLILPNENYIIIPTPSRKLLAFPDYNDSYGGSDKDYDDDDNTGSGYGSDSGSDSGSGSTNRVGTGAECSKEDIMISQGATGPMPNGIPTYTVDVENMCASESCTISNIHLTCGSFSSANLVNPSVFRRLDNDDCLLNDGAPLGPGQSLSFVYANTYAYPLSVSSFSCY